MKTLVRKETNLSTYIFSDDAVVLLGSEETQTPGLIILDMNNTNSLLYENVTPPDDWRGLKYKYENNIWTLNPDWIDPSQETT